MRWPSAGDWIGGISLFATIYLALNFFPAAFGVLP